MAAVEPDNCEHIATALLDEFRNLASLWAQTAEAIGRIVGDRPAVAAVLISARDAMLELLGSSIRSAEVDPFDPALCQYLIASMGSLPDERLRILFLDSMRNLIADEEVQRGTLAHLAIYPRTIFRRALEHNAAALILVHNHPSGDHRPSEEDILATHRLDQIGRALDVRILDHIVVTAAQVHHIMSEDSLAGPDAKPSAFTLRSDTDPAAGRALENALAVVRRRMLRRQLIGAPDLFGEPAWDMLLDLFVHECEGKPLAMSSLCISAGIPTSSAMKLIQKLCDADILERIPDHLDGRRSLMRLNAGVAHRLRAYFAEGTE
ncbi:JAB domain-containing protein [Sphingopyxis sp. PAMC25046]|uniref:JAB domain-containing protein n=1 Tax=Sphingopyxis sp. PAMC25046 TaxID=2565556 RepID=UPI0014471F33|nr:JAB domain-containing protein [Sphingopyxis sp. PAMC25046]